MDSKQENFGTSWLIKNLMLCGKSLRFSVQNFWFYISNFLKNNKNMKTFQGTYHANNDNFFDYEFQLPDIKNMNLNLNTLQKWILVFNTWYVYKNFAGAPWDLFVFLGGFLIAIQAKSLSSNAISGQPLVLSKKNNKWWIPESYENSFDGECPIKRWILFICVNVSITDNSLD